MNAPRAFDDRRIVFEDADLIVVDNNGHHFYNKENAEAGKFAFTTDSYNVYEICVISRQDHFLRDKTVV